MSGDLSRTEIIKFIKETGMFSNFQNLSKKEITDLYNNYLNTGVVPSKYKKKANIRGRCQVNSDCRTNKCVDNECVKNDNKNRVLKPLNHKTKLRIKTADKNVERCDSVRVDLKNHQQVVVNFMKRTSQKGLLLHHNVGSGKSITSIVIAKCLLSRFPKKNVVILTPTSVVKQFETEIERIGLSKEMLSRFEVFSHQMWLDRYASRQIRPRNNTILIVDEVHKFKSLVKNKNGKKTGIYSEYLIDAAKDSFKIILLTATPVQNNLKELTNYITMINNEDVETGYENLKGVFEDTKDKEVLENDYTGILKCKISHFKNKTKEDYPRRVDRDIFIPMGKRYQVKYDQVENKEIFDNNIKSIFELEDGTLPELEKFYSGIRRSVNGITVESPKIKWILNYIKKHQESNILIYSSWLKLGIDLIKSNLDDQGKEYVSITGKESKDQRRKAVEDYNTGNKKIMFITSAGSEGLDLKNTSAIILLEPFWNKSRNDQVIGRGIRYRSHINLPYEKQIVRVFNLYIVRNEDTKPTADVLLYNISKKKKNIIDQIEDQMRDASIENNDCV